MLVDSHCHLDFENFDEDRAETLARAFDAGVGMMVTICTRRSRFDHIRDLAQSDDRLYCSVGIHPHQVAEEETATLDWLLSCAADPKVVGIGETGLDYYYDTSPRADQAASFRTHIAAARESGLPLIVHTRDADEDMAAILTEEAGKGSFPGVLPLFFQQPPPGRSGPGTGVLYFVFRHRHLQERAGFTRYHPRRSGRAADCGDRRAVSRARTQPRQTERAFLCGPYGGAGGGIEGPAAGRLRPDLHR